MGDPGGQAGGAPRVANDSLNAEQLAIYLGIDAWVFAYEGNLERCWIDIHEEGQKTVGEGVFKPLESPRLEGQVLTGKILLFIRRGEVKLFVECGGSRSEATFGVGQDDLWWGWKSFKYGATSRLQKPVEAKVGEDVVLLTNLWQEAPSSAASAPAPKKVRLELKARFKE
jgi:hypothetical protein